ncbi:hypothetical protein G6011_01446 [Alternaria panax]|uniref:Uncharacterized protein n=1 Tax=Alternaria panax TaxID=48097 RepID=A0AAD4IKU1_9PLEO|nr:hypothetical protein G6011_01446 [Alternaria panax]
MKAIEKDTDRRAQVNVFVEGQVPALKEYVDGVFRKANSYAAKAVSLQSNKKIDTKKFLYKTTKGIIDTDIMVVPLLDVVATQGDVPETIGTLELRLYITRQLGLSHDVSEVEKYYRAGGNIEDKQTDNAERTASYKLIPPTSRMSFEKNAAPLEDRQPSLQQRRADAKRPGTEPWAMFRFHYRSQEDILAQGLVMTYDPDNKEKTEWRTLRLDPIPPFQLGEKPRKNDGDASSRSSSSMPTGKPSTLIRNAQPTPMIPIPAEKRPGPKPNSTDAAKTTSTTKQAGTATSKASPVALTKTITSPGTHDKFVTPLKGPIVKGKKALAKSETNSGASTTTTSTGGDTVVDTIAVTTSELAVDSIANVANLPGLNVRPAVVHLGESAVIVKEMATKPQQPSLPATKKPMAKSAPISTIVQKKKLDTPPVAAVTAKRNSPITNDTMPKPKRTKVAAEHLSPSIQPLADQRKKLDEMRKKRSETAQKQVAIDKKMGPDKQRMAEELDRLNQEMMEEESANTEEVEHYSTSVEILQEFRKAEGDI